MSADSCEEGKGAWVDEGWGDVQVRKQHSTGNCAQTDSTPCGSFGKTHA